MASNSVFESFPSYQQCFMRGKCYSVHGILTNFPFVNPSMLYYSSELHTIQ
uniref:Uncharacterized protein n=1 Tax=Chelydra serpentina TaxID=8475 RepID=A0A8C3S8Z9_CHESE